MSYLLVIFTEVKNLKKPKITIHTINHRSTPSCIGIRKITIGRIKNISNRVTPPRLLTESRQSSRGIYVKASLKEMSPSL